jgi:hypothetical protein
LTPKGFSDSFASTQRDPSPQLLEEKLMVERSRGYLAGLLVVIVLSVFPFSVVHAERVVETEGQIPASNGDGRHDAPCADGNSGEAWLDKITPALVATKAVSGPTGVAIQAILDKLSPQQKAQLVANLTGSREHYRSACIPLVVVLPANARVRRTEVYVENGTHHRMELCGDAVRNANSGDPSVRANPARICPAGWSRVETPPRRVGDTMVVVVGSWMKEPRRAQFKVFYE